LESNQPEELGRKITPGASRFGLIRRGLHRFFQRRDDDRGVGVAEEARALPARAKAHAPSGAKRTKEILREPKQLTSRGRAYSAMDRGANFGYSAARISIVAWAMTALRRA
jgi:hypothetical protein